MKDNFFLEVQILGAQTTRFSVPFITAVCPCVPGRTALYVKWIWLEWDKCRSKLSVWSCAGYLTLKVLLSRNQISIIRQFICTGVSVAVALLRGLPPLQHFDAFQSLCIPGAGSKNFQALPRKCCMSAQQIGGILYLKWWESCRRMDLQCQMVASLFLSCCNSVF